ncbi:MAG: TIGR01777 family oxidoreductase [Deltaproteobacteria bacterium]|nr:TIGR01777 family oxidoreductase [Deltaproteobacteria bacterium]
MKVFITGGTGFVGQTLTRRFSDKGMEVTVLTRRVEGKPPLPQGASYLEGDPRVQGAWQQRVPEHEVVINLAGASIFRRWTESAKEEIRESRIAGTKNLVEALKERKGRDATLLSASAVGYYGFHGDEELDEDSPPGDDFLASVAREWEVAALEARKFYVRVAVLRFGIVLGRQGGALKQMLPLFKWCLGAPLGSGRQWFSWIHEQDLAEIFLYLAQRRDIEGPVNCTSPNPVRNRDFTKALGRALNRPTFMPAVPSLFMRLIYGEFGSILVKGQRVNPERLTGAGFAFRYPEVEDALRNLLE